MKQLLLTLPRLSVCLSVSVSISTKQLESYRRYLCGSTYWCFLT